MSRVLSIKLAQATALSYLRKFSQLVHVTASCVSSENCILIQNIIVTAKTMALIGAVLVFAVVIQLPTVCLGK